jgi:hypothetical protein
MAKIVAENSPLDPLFISWVFDMVDRVLVTHGVLVVPAQLRRDGILVVPSQIHKKKPAA